MHSKRGWMSLILTGCLCSCSSKGGPESRLPLSQATTQDSARDASIAHSDERDSEEALGPDTTGPAAPTSESGNASCPKAQRGVRVGMLDSTEINEASGLIASRKNAGLLWVHNDSGDSARIFAIKQDGSIFAEVPIIGANAYDWEDIALGYGPLQDETYLFIGDVGDNEKKRASVQIYRIEEPRLDAQGKTSGKVRAFAIDVHYDDEAHDCETVLVDPIGGDLYLVTKAGLFEIDKDMPVYRVTADDMRDGSATAHKVSSAKVGPATGGDVLADGRGIAIRNYTSIRYWPRDPKRPLFDAFSEPPCVLPLGEPLGTQGEAFAFTADGSGYFTTSEGTTAPLLFYRFLE